MEAFMASFLSSLNAPSTATPVSLPAGTLASILHELILSRRVVDEAIHQPDRLHIPRLQYDAREALAARTSNPIG